MQTGWIVTLLLLLPNAFFLLLTPRNVPPETDGRRQFKVQVFETIERLGQIGSFVLPCFYSFRTLSVWDQISLGLFCVLMGFYYAGWVRYVKEGRQFQWLFAPMLGIPLPMAIAPVLAVLVAAINFHSWPLALAALILGTGHIPVSQLEWMRCQSSLIDRNALT
jgi:hypothetical protein